MADVGLFRNFNRRNDENWSMPSTTVNYWATVNAHPHQFNRKLHQNRVNMPVEFPFTLTVFPKIFDNVPSHLTISGDHYGVTERKIWLGKVKEKSVPRASQFIRLPQVDEKTN